MWITVNYTLRGKLYSFSPSLGWLKSKKVDSPIVDTSPVKVENAAEKLVHNLECINNPYKAAKPEQTYCCMTNRYIRLYGLLLVWCSKHCYPILYLLSYLRLNIYDSGEDACNVFCRIHPSKQEILCLSRSVFVATTSRRFKSEGTMVVGALLPSHSLHAWVMENGKNVCKNDVYWTNYRPLAFMN